MPPVDIPGKIHYIDYADRETTICGTEAGWSEPAAAQAFAGIIARCPVENGRTLPTARQGGRTLEKNIKERGTMAKNGGMYCVFADESVRPRMYGIQSRVGVRVGHISTDFQEVSRLAECCNSAGLSPIHLADVVEDFRRS